MLFGATSKLLTKSGLWSTMGCRRVLFVPLQSGVLVSAVFQDHEQCPPWSLR